jgi:hypothetical protein
LKISIQKKFFHTRGKLYLLFRWHRTFYKKTLTSICEIVWAYISTNFQKEGLIKYLFKFSNTHYSTWCSKKLVLKKSGTIYPTEQRCRFLELAIFQQLFSPKLFLIKYCMLVILYFKIIFNFWLVKIGFKN